MKNKKLLIALIAFVAVIAVVVGIWFMTRPEAPEAPAEGKLKFTVIVVHSDGTEKTFHYETDGGKLGDFLKEKGLAIESDSPGLYNIIDGETADWNVDQSFWNFYVGDELVNYGMNDAVIHDGAVYKLVYTKL